MMHRPWMSAIVAAVMTVGGPAFAHDDYRIIGTVTKVTPPTLTVKQRKDGKPIPMRTDSATLVTRNKQKVRAAELNAGVSVVVDARGDSLADLVVLEVRIVPLAAKRGSLIGYLAGFGTIFTSTAVRSKTSSPSASTTT